MKTPTLTQSQKAGNFLILISWLLFALALVLPAGTYIWYFEGNSVSTKTINGWTAFMLSLESSAFSPFILIRQLEKAGNKMTLIVLPCIFLMAFTGISPRTDEITTRLFNRRIYFVVASSILISITTLSMPDLYVRLLNRSTTAPFQLFMILSVCISFCLNSHKARNYLNFSIFLLLLPVLILLQNNKSDYIMAIVFPCITIGTLLMLMSTIKAIRNKPGHYFTWITINLAIATCFMPFGIQDLSPAFIAWSSSIISLAIGNQMRNWNLGATEHLPQPTDTFRFESHVGPEMK